MNQYLMINHGVGTPENWDMYFTMLHQDGHMIGGSSLGEGIAVTDGVFSEARTPSITGYILIHAKDLESAKDIARQSPVHQAGGTVEVFPLIRENE